MFLICSCTPSISDAFVFASIESLANKWVCNPFSSEFARSCTGFHPPPPPRHQTWDHPHPLCPAPASNTYGCGRYASYWIIFLFAFNKIVLFSQCQCKPQIQILSRNATMPLRIGQEIGTFGITPTPSIEIATFMDV